MDYKKAPIKAFSAYFPAAEIHACFFDLVRNMKEQVAANGLSGRYRNDADFALEARMISAMAFIPPEPVEDALTDSRGELAEGLQSTLDYFENNYIGRLQVGRDGSLGRREALFPVFTWSVCGRTLQGDSCTNNYAEAFHRNDSSKSNIPDC